MKRILTTVLVVVATVMTGCTNTSLLNVTPLRSAGKPLPAPENNVDQCKPEGAGETLESVRYVEGFPFYYMDYTAKVDWDQLSFSSGELDIYSWTKVCDKRDALLYNNPEPSSEPRQIVGACSGFVCYNPEGELLFGRNYDYHLDPLVVVFNKNVGPGEHRNVLMSDWQIELSFDRENSPYKAHDCFLTPGINTNILLRQPFYTVDGMNEEGLCMAAFQLPAFKDPKHPVEEYGPNISKRPEPVSQKTGKTQIQFFGMIERILTKCATIQEAVDYLNAHDFAAVYYEMNLHWLIADANNEFRVLEYWRDADGKDFLYVMDEEARSSADFLAESLVPYGYRSIENHYCNPEASITYQHDSWQKAFSPKLRINTMMVHYSPVMTEEEALLCLQYGNFELEQPGLPTVWSCVYNPKQRTILFNLHDDLTNVYSIDLKKDFE